MIPTRIHGILDYVVGLFLMAAPWVLGFAHNGAATWVPVVLGAGVIVYSLCTRYEYGVVPVLSMTTHLWLDGLGGILLAASPWVFGFADVVWVPHLILGIFEILAAATTQRTPVLRRA